MESVATKLAGAAGVLAVLWVGVFWLYPSSGRRYGVVDLGPTPSELADTPPAAVKSEIHRERPVTPPVHPAPSEQLANDRAPEVVKPSPAPVVTRPTIEAPRFEIYIVKGGDTLEKIAKARLGSSAYAKAIAQANPMKDPHRLKVGDEVRVPLDPSNIQGKVLPEIGKPASESGGAGPGGAGWTEYTAVAGDSLSKISQTVYGSSKHWKLILDANRKTLPEAEKLRVGMRLMLPPKPAE